MKINVEVVRSLVKQVDDWVAENNPHAACGSYGNSASCCWIGAAREATGLSVWQIETEILGQDISQEVMDHFDKHGDFYATSYLILKVVENL